jgi:hypothetical protein
MRWIIQYIPAMSETDNFHIACLSGLASPSEAHCGLDATMVTWRQTLRSW